MNILWPSDPSYATSLERAWPSMEVVLEKRARPSRMTRQAVEKQRARGYRTNPFRAVTNADLARVREEALRDGKK